MSKKYPIVLSIAGSDSGGGAGIQADIKAISATGAYAATAITAITAQNTLGVQEIFPLNVSILSAQIHSVLEDIGADCVKIGMLHSSEVINTIKACLQEFSISNIVLDPVMVSTSGHRLIEQEAISSLKEELIPIARVITPNIPEAQILSGRKIQSQADLSSIARSLAIPGKLSVFMKAGHLSGDEVVDIFYNAESDELLELRSRRINSVNTHGTGCSLSSALASYLAQGLGLSEAAIWAKEYISKAIEAGAEYSIGRGHGPVNHFWQAENYFSE